MALELDVPLPAETNRPESLPRKLSAVEKLRETRDTRRDSAVTLSSERCLCLAQGETAEVPTTATTGDDMVRIHSLAARGPTLGADRLNPSDPLPQRSWMLTLPRPATPPRQRPAAAPTAIAQWTMPILRRH
jgi:hypothetical protein